jgi:hypothetical protein
MTTAAPAPLTLMLFDLDGRLAPGAAGKDRCGRLADSTGLPCMSWPRRGAEACSHHITSDELAVVEALRSRPRAVA